MTYSTAFFKTCSDRERGWMWNSYLFKLIAGTEIDIDDKKVNITPGIQKVLTDTSNIPLKKLNDQDRKIFINIFLKTSILRTIKQHVVNVNQVDINNLKPT